jgi:hypothetical protein
VAALLLSVCEMIHSIEGRGIGQDGSSGSSELDNLRRSNPKP